MEKYSYLSWLETVGKQMHFPPDRKAALAELADHMSDRREDFIRNGMSTIEASDATAAVMGDPVEVGRTLNRLHNPVLGWIWFLFRWLFRILAISLVCLTVFGVYEIAWLVPHKMCSDGCERLPYAMEFVGEDSETLWLKSRPVVIAGVYDLSVDHGFWIKGTERQVLSVGFRIDYPSVFDLPPAGIAARLVAEDDLGNRIDPDSVGVGLLYQPDPAPPREEVFHISVNLEDALQRQWLRFYIPGTEFDLTVHTDGRVTP